MVRKTLTKVIHTTVFCHNHGICFVFPNLFEMALIGTALRGGFASYTTYTAVDDFLSS
jgi:hypothetical protein